jgi:AAA15 family ATPase/GTPase
VYIIDELDRSLHHLLLRRLLKKFLNSCNADTREQIIFTTHDLLLMDQELMRRDEMFAVERDNLGASSITPINEYRGLRSDKIILKSYLQGRLGGIPRL